jgi:phosphatidylglycerophosphate synthase
MNRTTVLVVLGVYHYRHGGAVRAVHTGPVTGLLAQLVLLAALDGTVGLSGAGWVVGIACGVITNALLARGLARFGAHRLGPADQVTLTRATLAGGVAALTADPFTRPAPVTTLVALTVVALVLDAVDGWVARRTETESTLGWLFDGEVDAFLILVLSVYVARSAGAWVLAIGAARYAFLAAGWLLPWMRRTLPPRYWRKVVAGTQGVALTFAVADVLPRFLTNAVLAVSLALLAESFGRDVGWLWRRRRDERGRGMVSSGRPERSGERGELRMGGGEPRSAGHRSGFRTAASWVVAVLASLLAWFALVAPNELDRLTPGAFVRIPLEALLFVGVVLLLPPRAGRIAAVAVGVALGLLAVVKVLDMGFFAALGRPFKPMTDWTYFGSAMDLLNDSIGRRGAIGVLVTAGVLGVAALIFMPLFLLRLRRLVDRRRAKSIRAVTALGVVWILCAVFGVEIVTGAPIASTSAVGLAYDRVSQAGADLQDQRSFAEGLAVDPLRNTPRDDLLTGLRGKDVLFVFVESYGRVAVQGSAFSPQVNAVLDDGTRRLRAAGFSAKSAFLTSSTFGGISWLAHSTLHSGLWIDSQQRYDELVASDRSTLSDAFKRAGWWTVGNAPANSRDWPEGRSFYHYDKLYDARNVGYVGPKFSYANVPDQYTLSAFHRLELAKRNRAPVMAEIDLVSSHTPWAPLPHMIDWNQLGDGSVFDGMPGQGQSPGAVWRDPSQVRTAYGQSIEYSLSALISFVEKYHDNNLVLVVLGDHQPATIVTGRGASHDVPITIISHDPAVVDRISPWGWQDGMRPFPDAPVWPMDAFRDRFLKAYGPTTG